MALDALTYPGLSSAANTASGGLGGSLVIVIEAEAGPDPLLVPNGNMLLTADFVRSGDDLLLVGQDGAQVLIRGYLSLDNPPDLMTEMGGLLRGELVLRLAGPEAPGQYAQDTLALGAEPIGQVEDAAGEVTATRVDGTTVTLNVGDAVYMGDILETGAEGAISIVFVDQSTFSLGEEGRMVLDEMIYDPVTAEGSSAFSVLTGVFVFVSGEIAANNPDGMIVSTPVAVVGIRGTHGGGKADADGQENLITLFKDPGGTTGTLVVRNASGEVIIDLPGLSTTILSQLLPPDEPFFLSGSEMGDLFKQVSSVLPADQKARLEEAVKDANERDESNRSDEEGLNLADVAPEAGEGQGDGEPVADPVVSGDPVDDVLVGDIVADLLEEILEAITAPEPEPAPGPASAPPPDDDDDIVVVPEPEPEPEPEPSNFTGDGVGSASVGNDIFLGGNFIELGLDDNGALGPLATAPTQFHNVVDNQLSMVADADGFDSGAAQTSDDFFLPGSPVENFTVGFGTISSGGTTNFTNTQKSFTTEITMAATDQTSGTTLQAQHIGTANSELQVTQVISFDDDDTFFTTTITLENVSGGSLFNIRYMRNADPDQDSNVAGGAATTNNDVRSNPTNGIGDAIVVAEGQQSGLFASYFAENDGSGPEARVSAFGFENTDPFNASAFNTPVDPDGTSADIGITIVFDVGTLADGTSTAFSFRQSINVATSGNDLIVGGSPDTIDGGAGNDEIMGLGDDDILSGGAGNDILEGGADTDSLDGGTGDDSLDGGQGLNNLTGGTGNDTYIFDVGSEQSVQVNLASDASGTADTFFVATGTLGQLTIDPALGNVSIEGNNLLISNRDELEEQIFFIDNFLTTGTIENFVFESVGTTPFVFTTTSGGSGNDIAVLTTSTTTFDGAAGNDVLYASSSATTLVGGADNDFLIGSAGADTLQGGDGDDRLSGAGGLDVLQGGDGNDILEGGAGGLDLLEGGAGNDTYIVGSGEAGDIHDSSGTADTLLVDDDVDFPFDIALSGTSLTISFRDGSGTTFAVSSDESTGGGLELVQAELNDGTLNTFTILDSATGGTGNDILVGGSGQDLVLSGGDGNDLIFGNGGNDGLTGGAGNDFLSGGAGNDNLNGTTGDDTADYANAVSAVTVDLSVSVAQNTGGAGTDTLTNIDNLRGSTFADTLTGDGNDNVLTGGGGNDTYQVSTATTASAVVVVSSSAGSADKLALGSSDGDRIPTDFSFARSGDNLVISDEFGGAPSTHRVTITDHFLAAGQVEQFEFTETPDTTFTFAGTTPTANNDLLFNDNAGAGVTIAGGAGDDIVVGNVLADLLQGDAGNDHLIGQGGGDTLQGGAGNDELAGGAGNDQLEGGAGNDFYIVDDDTGGAADTILDSGGTDVLELLSSLDLTNAVRAGDFLTVSYLEVDTANSGSVTIDGETGTAVEFLSTSNNVQELLQIATGTAGSIGDDLIAGTSGADTLTGDDGFDFLFGGGGNDNLNGGTGDDELRGGGGVDSLTGGDGADIFQYVATADGEAGTDGVLPTGITGDIVTDFVFGTDKFEINGFAFGFTNNNALVLNTNFFVENNFDGSPDLGADAYIVFDDTNDKLIAAENGVAGYTVLATITGDSVAAADISIANGFSAG